MRTPSTACAWTAVAAAAVPACCRWTPPVARRQLLRRRRGLKLRGLDSLLKIGDQLLENPVIASGVSRMVPQSYRGVTLKNYHFRAFELDAGFVEATRLRNQSGHSHLTSGYGNGTKGGIAADRESPHIAWLGASSAPAAARRRSTAAA